MQNGETQKSLVGFVSIESFSIRIVHSARLEV